MSVVVNVMLCKRHSLQALELSQRTQAAVQIVSNLPAPSKGGPIYRFWGACRPCRPAGWLVLTKEGDVETNPGPTTLDKQVTILFCQILAIIINHPYTEAWQGHLAYLGCSNLPRCEEKSWKLLFYLPSTNITLQLWTNPVSNQSTRPLRFCCS